MVQQIVKVIAKVVAERSEPIHSEQRLRPIKECGELLLWIMA